MSGPVVTVRDKSGADGTDTLSEIEKLIFSDANIDSSTFVKTAALSKTAVDSLTELYIASFNRAPDALGLYYWGGRLHDGMSLEDIAKSFFVQPETTTKYPPTMSAVAFATEVYGNVLGRAPDDAGLRYWVKELETGSVTRDKFLLAIINGAHANLNAAQDVATLMNKVAVGEHYALAAGLSHVGLAVEVMSDVTYDSATVAAANQLADNVATLAASGIDAYAQLQVQLLGIV